VSSTYDTGGVSSTCDTDDAGDRLDWLWTGFFVATLVLGAVISALSADGSTGFRLLPLLGVAVLLVLDRVCGRLAPDPETLGRAGLAVALVWYVASVTLLILLVEVYPPFSLAVYGFVPRIFTRLPLVPAVVAAALVLPAMILGQGGVSAAADARTWYASLGSGALSILIGVFITAIARQSAQRREALAALTAAQAEVAQQAHRAGVAEERARLAREIHDTLAQGLVSVLTQVEAAERALARDPAAGAHHLDLAREAARAALDDARRSVQALRPASLQEAPSLPAAIERVAGRWSEQSGVPVEVSVTGSSRPLAPEVEVTLLRAAQEGLANVSRHARASRATVTLSYDGDEVAVDVDDDGTGFDPVAARAPRDGGGFGIEALRQRARALGGSAHVESEPGRGATLVLRVPAHPAEEVVG
jgi:signal transduction histidine kinase